MDLKNTIFLPDTGFPMRGQLPAREPDILKSWQVMDLYARLREKARREALPKYILHDGPPYANGHLHMGHALNKILKDFVVRSYSMLGYDTPYVPGWDCHGLPIEWQIEQQYRKAGKNKDDVPILEFRKECRDYAAHWIEIQAAEFQRLGVIGDWQNPYLTMSPAAEAIIAGEIGKFLINGSLYRGARPVLWSVAEKTALADAEVEYHDLRSPAIFVRFPIKNSPQPELAGAFAVIWTTTPWTIPANRAIAYGTDFTYSVIEVVGVTETAAAKVGERLLIANALAAAVATESGISNYKEVAQYKGFELAGTVACHPLQEQGYDFEVPLLAAEFVTLESGSGLVHIAPSHGTDDFYLGQRHGLEIPKMVDEDGCYYPHVPLFAGLAILRADGKKGEADRAVIAALKDRKGLLAEGSVLHSYPHSWRSKAPLIFRTTEQWFIDLDRTGLREAALRAIEETEFFPPQGQVRLRSMVETRPDWCISRQRAWGVPIALFLHKKTGEILRDEKVLRRIVEAFAKEGSDIWFSGDYARFLAPEYSPEDYRPVTDIVEVWFESGSTHAFVLEPRRDQDLAWPADLYLEGSDQHRGWFQSSLLESCGTRGRAPFKAVLTHGFLLDEQGRKMSKSAGNGITPAEVMAEHGADILRLWVAASDYQDDIRLGREILKHHADAYRRFRNTLRYILGGLSGYREEEALRAGEMPELERFILARLFALDGQLRNALRRHDFRDMFVLLHNFCAVDLSAFYFDIRKDALYCDSPRSSRRRACRTVMMILFDWLTAWLAPILCFTAEEAWRYRPLGKGPESVHLRKFPDLPPEWVEGALLARWETLRALRKVVTGALELARADRKIGSSLQAAPQIYANEDYRSAVVGLDLAEIAITSDAELLPLEEAPAEAFRLAEVPGVAALVRSAEGEKCARCWKVLPEVAPVKTVEAALCERCEDAVREVAPSAKEVS